MPQCVRCKRVHNPFLSRFSTIKAQPSIISWNLSYSSFVFFFLLWHAVHRCRGFHIGDPNERKWAPNKLFDDRSQEHWNECCSCTCGRYFCVSPPHYHHGSAFTAQKKTGENRPINNRYYHCFELLFGCLRSQANALFCLLQQSAHRSSRKMVQLVQRDWRVRLDQKWCWACTPASEEWTNSDPPSRLSAPLLILLFFFKKNFLRQAWIFVHFALRHLAPLSCSVSHQQQMADVTLQDWQKQTDRATSALFAPLIQTGSCCFVEPWHTGPSSLSNLLSSAFYLCWRVASMFKNPCVLAWKCVFGFLASFQ